MIDLMFINIFFSAPYLAYHPTYRKLLILSFTVVTHTMFSGPISCYNTIIPKVECKKYSAKTLQFLSVSIINPTIRFPEIDMDWGSGINASFYKKKQNIIVSLHIFRKEPSKISDKIYESIFKTPSFIESFYALSTYQLLIYRELCQHIN